MLKALLLVLWSITVSVDGPTEAQIGQVVTLTSKATDAVKTKWLVPDALEFKVGLKGTLQIMASQPGTYSITFIGVSEGYDIAADMHTIVFKGLKE